MNTFKRLLATIALVTMLAAPGIATMQDTPTPEGEPTAEATVEPTPAPVPPVEDEQPAVDPQNIITAVLLVLVAVLVVGGILLDTALKGAFNSIPVVARGPVKTIIEGVLDQMRGVVEGTPDLTDDELFKIIDKRVREIIADEMPAILAASTRAAHEIAHSPSGASSAPPHVTYPPPAG